MKISNGVINSANIQDSRYEGRLSLKVKKMQGGKYYHNKGKTCDMKSVCDMAHIMGEMINKIQ